LNMGTKPLSSTANALAAENRPKSNPTDKDLTATLLKVSDKFRYA
jgi:hypothetical protein